MTSDFQILKGLYNSFDPFQPLSPGDSAYVDCKEVRGDGDIIRELGKEILFSEDMTCQLYGGHRGGGKSTELLRLEKYLQDNNYFVVYFQADQEDIDPEDTQYTDILLACTRCLGEKLKSANSQPLRNWLKERWEDLKDLALTELSWEDLSIEAQISQFAKLTANLRAEPGQRQKIRERINPHTVTLIKALNEFIEEAKKDLPSKYFQLVVIVDSLDRIVPILEKDNRTNHDHIFIDRSEQLKGLDCHLIYTVAISLLYSNRASDLLSIYGNTHVLPMIAIRNPVDDSIYQPGLEKIKEIIAKRINKVNPNYNLANLDTDIFEDRDTLNRLCLMSGGHVRELMLLIRGAIKHIDSLPISQQAVQRSIIEIRDVYRRTVEQEQWKILAQVHKTKQLQNNDIYRDLLFRRCLLEYPYVDNPESLKYWCDVHPLIKEIPEFQAELAKLTDENEGKDETDNDSQPQ